MKIAIHNRPGSYSDEWIDYCKKHNIDFKLVNCLDSDIVKQLKDCDGLMWHWPHWDFKAAHFARQLTYSLELSGKKVFPDSRTCWHYDDKVGQKYLFEAMGIPRVPTYTFYDKKEAISWCDKTDFPKVFKLRKGASSMNVKLARRKSDAKRLIRKAFGKGFPVVDRYSLFEDRIWKIRRDKDLKSIIGLFKGLVRLFIPTELEKFSPNQKGYVYFQDFIPDNRYDTRIMVIGDCATGLKRMVRENDFRASGSGSFTFNPDEIDIDCVKMAFEVAARLKTQSVAFDFVSHNNKPLIVEISYASVVDHNNPGYWDKDLKWHYAEFIEERYMIEIFIKSLTVNLPNKYNYAKNSHTSPAGKLFS
jgi:glutathione synthase/RimK-type ligase-like ATP-grasp enzyme